MHYQYLVVGAGLYGAVFAHEMEKRGKDCLVIEKRDHIAGNIYTKEVKGIQVHEYGAHIFHSSDKEVWNNVNQIVEYIVHNGMMKDLSVLQEAPFTDHGSIVEVFTDLSVWAGIRQVIERVNANAAA